jgi:hypothetical protein
MAYHLSGSFSSTGCSDCSFFSQWSTTYGSFYNYKGGFIRRFSGQVLLGVTPVPAAGAFIATFSTHFGGTRDFCGWAPWAPPEIRTCTFIVITP